MKHSNYNTTTPSDGTDPCRFWMKQAPNWLVFCHTRTTDDIDAEGSGCKASTRDVGNRICHGGGSRRLWGRLTGRAPEEGTQTGQ